MLNAEGALPDFALVGEGLSFYGSPLYCHCFEEVESTNSIIKDLISQHGPEGAIALALKQTGGYGRQNRNWESPLGGLYLSVLLTPQAHGVGSRKLPTLSLVVALAVRDALRFYADDAIIEVKWPNDVLLLGGDSGEQRTSGFRQSAPDPNGIDLLPGLHGKICGISLEAIGDAVCVGIGINVFKQEGQPAPPSRLPLAYLAASANHPDVPGLLKTGYEASLQQKKALAHLAQHVLSALAERYGLWCQQGFDAFVGEFNDHSYLAGKNVSIENAEGATLCEGKVVRIDAGGNLVLADENGCERAIASGEAHVRFEASASLAFDAARRLV